MRDLARYQARSAAALGAISLALAIAATVAISAAATVTPAADANLANNQLVVYLSSGNGSGPGSGGAAIPQRTGAEVRSLQPAIDALASSLHAQSVVPLTEAFAGDAQPLSPDGTVGYVTASLGKERTLMHDGRHGIEITDEIPLYVATPALLRYYRIRANDIDTNTDIITGRKDLHGYAVIAPSGGPTPCDASQPNCRVHGVKPGPGPAGANGRAWCNQPSKPSSFRRTRRLRTRCSPRGVLRDFGLSSVTAGWFLQTRSPLTTAQINSAQRAGGRGRGHRRNPPEAVVERQTP